MRWPRPLDTAMWRDPGTWIALGVSALFIVVGFVMHRVTMRVLKAPSAVNSESLKPVDKARV